MAKLLFITQTIDKNDRVLGFTHRWVEGLAQQFESVTVICLGVGEHQFPPNVKICSLGKEKNVSKIRYLMNFYKYIWLERRQYDSVFVHMNPIYVVLGGPWWRLTGRKVALWYTHLKATTTLRLALCIVNNAFTADSRSFPIRSSKVTVLGHGIATDIFRREGSIQRKLGSILSLGRISPVKQIERLIEALNILRAEDIDFNCRIVGDPVLGHEAYYAHLKTLVPAELKNHIVFESGVQRDKSLQLYNESEIFVNTTRQGSFDKTILEAMACETLVVTTNKSFQGILDESLFCQNDDPVEVARVLKNALALSSEIKKQIGFRCRAFIVENHDLNKLVSKLVQYYSS